MKYKLWGWGRHEPRKFHFPPLYAKARFCFGGASELDVADIVQRFEEPLCGLVETVGDVVDDFGGVKPGQLQTAYQECQKPYTYRHTAILLINSRATLVTIVAPSKRPATSRY